MTVAGDFNDWHETSCRLTHYPCGVWETVIPLKKGVYQYKFIVDGEWTHDPSNPCKMLNEFGGTNSALEVQNDGDVLLLRPSPGARDTANTGRFPARLVRDAVIYEVFLARFPKKGHDAVRRRIPELS